MKDLEKIAREIRYLIIKSLRPLESHHIGCSLSIVEILTYLYWRKIKVNPKNYKEKARDIFILSKGHAALALYATLCKKGFFNEELMKTYDQDGFKMPEHPSTSVPGIELSTGSLGHGLPVAVGFALSFKNDKKPNKVYVLLSDGELNEGSNWEAIMFAGHHRLNNLIGIIDLNGFQGYSQTSKIINLFPLKKKIESFNWSVWECDGHNFLSLNKAFSKVKFSKTPTMIIAKTTKGKGISFFEGKFDSHYKSIDQQTKRQILLELSKINFKIKKNKNETGNNR